jgi:hypothetical protein
MFVPFVFVVRLRRRIDAYPQSALTQPAEKNAAHGACLCGSASLRRPFVISSSPEVCC